MQHLIPMYLRRLVAPAAVLVALSAIAPHAAAAINGYTARTAFDAATAGMPRVITDFESSTAGTVFGPGTGPAGSGFVLDSTASVAFGEDPMVGDLFWTTSGTRYLGSDNGDAQFLAGDSITFTFAAPASGFGLYVIGGSDLLGGDIRLSMGGAAVPNVDDADKLADGNGSFAFFLGLVSDDGATFGSATLTGIDPGGGAFYVFAVDDVVVASPVPEPSMAVTLLAGVAALLAWRRRVRS